MVGVFASTLPDAPVRTHSHTNTICGHCGICFPGELLACWTPKVPASLGRGALTTAEWGRGREQVGTTSLPFSIPGLIAVFKYHQKNHFPDMYTLHSWCGMLAFGGYCIQWLLGLCFFLFPGASLSLRSRYKPQHVFFGLFLLVLSIAAGLLGILEMLLFKIRDQYSSFAPEGVLANVLGLLLVAFGGVMGYILTREEWRRPPLEEELALSMDFKKLTEEESPASPN